MHSARRCGGEAAGNGTRSASLSRRTSRTRRIARIPQLREPRRLGGRRVPEPAQHGGRRRVRRDGGRVVVRRHQLERRAVALGRGFGDWSLQTASTDDADYPLFSAEKAAFKPPAGTVKGRFRFTSERNPPARRHVRRRREGRPLTGRTNDRRRTTIGRGRAAPGHGALKEGRPPHPRTGRRARLAR